MFYVFNQADDNGFHEIKNECGEAIADACDPHEQTAITLEVMGHADAEVEVVYNREVWDALGRQSEQK